MRNLLQFEIQFFLTAPRQKFFLEVPMAIIPYSFKTCNVEIEAAMSQLMRFILVTSNILTCLKKFENLLLASFFKVVFPEDYWLDCGHLVFIQKPDDRESAEKQECASDKYAYFWTALLPICFSGNLFTLLKTKRVSKERFCRWIISRCPAPNSSQVFA